MARNFHYGETKAQKQAKWLQDFEALVVAAEPKYAGRIEWPSARHFYFTGCTPGEAATRYIENRAG